jgi:hypothetical protein
MWPRPPMRPRLKVLYWGIEDISPEISKSKKKKKKSLYLNYISYGPNLRLHKTAGSGQAFKYSN